MVTAVTRGPYNREAGFTLIELLMAMVISTAIMGSLVLVSAQMSRSYYSQLDGAAVQQEGRFALDWIVRTLQSAGNNPLTIVTSLCPAAGTTFRTIQRDPDGNGIQNDIRVHSDMNGNGLLGGIATGACTEEFEDITIKLKLGASPTTITKRDRHIDAADLDMTDTVITGLTFAYLDCARATTTDDDDVCYIQVTVTSQTPTVNNNTNVRTTYTNSAEVRMRTR